MMESVTKLWRDKISTKRNLCNCKVISVLLIFCISQSYIGAVMVDVGDDDGSTSGSDKAPENHISQVRYRTRPVAPFNSNSDGSSKTLNSTDTDVNSSSEIKSSEPSGSPFFAVHDLSSQTFEKLHENWRNVEAFLRSLQARRPQDESQASSGTVASTSDQNNNQRRTPSFNSNNVFTFRYHPVVLEGESPSRDMDNLIGGSTPPRSFNGANHFGPYPFDPSKDHSSKTSDMERHTVATIYTIGICLTIMAIGSVMFILINKCDGSSYTRTVPIPGVTSSRIARSALSATGRTSGGRQQNGRSRGSRQGATRNGNELTTTGSSANIPASANCMFEADAKMATDLPPSYDSLFPENTSNLDETIEIQPCGSNSVNAGVNTHLENVGNNNTQTESRIGLSPTAPPSS